MKSAGNDDSGYSVDVLALGIQIRAWGFWDAALATNFVAAVLDAIRANPQRSWLTLDASQLKPQRDEGQAALRELVETTAKLGQRGELIVANAITKMQLARIIREARANTWTMRGATSSPPADGGA